MAAPQARPAELRLVVIGSDRIVVAAYGAFTAASFDAVKGRLARLVAGAPACVHIDCSRITQLDPDVADLFAQAATTLSRSGGVLELAGVPDAHPGRGLGSTTRMAS